MKENRYTVRDVVEMTGLSERSIRRYLREGKLSGMKLGGVWRFTKEDIETMFVRQETDQDIAAKTGDTVRRFVRGEHKDLNTTIQACIIVDINDASNQSLNLVKDAVDHVVNTHESIDARIMPTRDSVRVTLIGDLEHIDTFTDALKRLNHL